MNSSVEQKHPKFSTFEFGNEFDDGDFRSHEFRTVDHFQNVSGSFNKNPTLP